VTRPPGFQSANVLNLSLSTSSNTRQIRVVQFVAVGPWGWTPAHLCLSGTDPFFISAKNQKIFVIQKRDN